ncbi:hypothetical protein JXM83_00990 [Candidatus Woesearchaeota archaeon]|nr:hypothetical protein [Candidatus Woesearchaeota archaeon]
MIKKEVFLSVFFVVFLLNFTSFVASESLDIRNVGQIGFNGTSSDFTSTTTVILDLSVNSSSTNCSCGNFDGVNLTFDIWDFHNFSILKKCDDIKYWLLDTSLNSVEETKFVRCLINHTNGIVTLVHDSIVYNPRGYGLDLTPPENFSLLGLGSTISLSESNIISFNWSESYDWESNLLQIPITYSYRILLEGLEVVNWTSVGVDNFAKIILANELLFPSSSFTEGDNVTIQVRAENSAGLYTIVSRQMTLDLVGPFLVGIESLEIDNGIWYSFLSDELSLDRLYFNWTFNDTRSDVVEYSFILTQNSSVNPDAIPEGIIGSFHLTTNYLLDNLRILLKEGENYFKIKAKDSAGNWGPVFTFNINIDNEPPSTPLLYDQGLNVSHDHTELIGVIFNWTVIDVGCGVVNHFVEIDNDIGFESPDFSGLTGSSSQYFNFSTLDDGVYYIRVQAIDCMNHSSSFSDLTRTIKHAESFIISEYRPSGEVATKRPYLYLETSRISVCYYKQSIDSDYSIFDYTNDTYHHAVLSLNYSSYVFDIRCIDMLNETRYVQLGIDVLQDYFVSSMYLSSNKNSFFPGERITMPLQILPKVSQIPKEDFTLYLDKKKYTDFVVNDLGDGYYLFSFYVPNSAGDHSLSLEVDGTDSNDFDFTVDEPYLSIAVESSTIRSFEKLVSDYGNVVFARGVDFSVGMSGIGNDISVDKSRFSIEVPLENDGYVFVTSSSFDPSKREDSLYYGGFVNLLDPTFGFLAEGIFDFNFVLAMDDVIFLTDYLDLSGKKSISIQNIGKDSRGRKQIFISALKTQNFTGDAN